MGTAFHYACRNGHAKTVENIIKNSAEFNIDLNAKNIDGWTAFHLACCWGRTSTIDVMIDNFESVEIDFTVRDNDGRTGFQLAQARGHFGVVKMENRLKKVSRKKSN